MGMSLLWGKKTTIILSSVPSCDLAKRVTSREHEVAPLAASVEQYSGQKYAGYIDVRHTSGHRPEISQSSATVMKQSTVIKHMYM